MGCLAVCIVMCGGHRTNTWESAFSFHRWGPGTRTQADRFESRHLYPLSHLPSPPISLNSSADFFQY